LCFTTAGRFGFFPPLTHAGDVVAAVSGLRVPLVLRPVAGEGGKYLLVGAAFVSNFPRPRPFDLSDDETSWLTLV
jgi:hypothetical protein